jgi:hypothetical protein
MSALRSSWGTPHVGTTIEGARDGKPVGCHVSAWRSPQYGTAMRQSGVSPVSAPPRMHHKILVKRLVLNNCARPIVLGSVW